MKKKQKKYPITLLEIMIVIFLIGLIGSVVGVNMKGSMDKGKAFKTEQAKAQIRDILLLAVNNDHPIDDVVAQPLAYLKESGIVKNPANFLKDGWGAPFEITKVKGNDIRVHSEKLDAYKKKTKVSVLKGADPTAAAAADDDDDD